MVMLHCTYDIIITYKHPWFIVCPEELSNIPSKIQLMVDSCPCLLRGHISQSASHQQQSEPVTREKVKIIMRKTRLPFWSVRHGCNKTRITLSIII